MTQATILVVEDDFISAAVLQAMLSAFPVQVHWVETATAALQWLQQHSAQLLLLDYQLAEQNSIELYQQLVMPRPPAALLTAHGDAALEGRAAAAGIQWQFRKPLNPQQLEQLLRITGCIE